MLSFKFLFLSSQFFLCFIYMLGHIEMTLSNIKVFTYLRHCITHTFDYKRGWSYKVLYFPTKKKQKCHFLGDKRRKLCIVEEKLFD